MTPEKEKDMEKHNDNARIGQAEEDVVVLGTASVETRGGGGKNTEYLGQFVIPGISED